MNKFFIFNELSVYEFGQCWVVLVLCGTNSISHRTSYLQGDLDCVPIEESKVEIQNEKHDKS